MAKFVTRMSFDTQWKPRWKPHVFWISYPNHTLLSSDSSLDIKIHASKQKKLSIRTEFKNISTLGNLHFNKIILTIKLMKLEIKTGINTHSVDTKYCSINSFRWISLYLRFAPIQWQIFFANNSDSSIMTSLICKSSALKPNVNQVISERTSRRNGYFSLPE